MRRRVGMLAAVALGFAGVGFAAPAAHADSVPVVNVGDAGVVEGDSGISIAKVPLDLSTVAANAVTVYYRIAVDSADAADFTFTGKTAKTVFQVGQVDKQLAVKVKGDPNTEPDDHVKVEVTAVTGSATIGDGSGGVTILDDDANGPASMVEANIGDVTVTEGDGGVHKALIPVTLNEPAPTDLSLTWAIDCSTARLGSDYSGKSTGTVSFKAGQQSKAVTVKLAADTTGEQVKKIYEGLKIKSGSVHLNRKGGTVTLRDDDPLAPGDVEMVSVAYTGGEAHYPLNPIAECLGFHAPAGESSISGDGNFVAFQSEADDLVPNDTNGLTDVFVRDRYAGTTERVSLMSDGSQVEPTDVPVDETGFGVAGYSPAISSDGRFVAFDSQAQLVAADTDGGFDTYLFDRDTNTVELVSEAIGGGGSDATSANGVDVSADGRYVAFSSMATNLVAADTDPGPATPGHGNGVWEDVFVRDMVDGTTTLVSTDDGGFGQEPQITPDGSMVVYRGGLTSTDHTWNAYARDMATGDVGIVSLTSTDQPADMAIMPAISADGTKVAFTGFGTVVPGLPNPSVGHIYVRDLTAGSTELVDVAGTGMTTEREPLSASLSSDGRYVTFGCWCERTTSSMGHEGVYRTDRTLGVTEEVDVKPNGTPANQDSRVIGLHHFMSDDGALIAFGSLATNFVPSDSNDHADIFVKRME